MTQFTFHMTQLDILNIMSLQIDCFLVLFRSNLKYKYKYIVYLNDKYIFLRLQQVQQRQLNFTRLHQVIFACTYPQVQTVYMFWKIKQWFL